MIKLQLIPDGIITGIAQSGPNNVTGWGIALVLSLAVNYFIYKEFKYLQSRFLDHLTKLTETLEEIRENFKTPSK
jgi:hypothetical protein